MAYWQLSSPATIECELAASTRSVKDSGKRYVVNYKQAAMESSKLVTGTFSAAVRRNSFHCCRERTILFRFEWWLCVYIFLAQKERRDQPQPTSLFYGKGELAFRYKIKSERKSMGMKEGQKVENITCRRGGTARFMHRASTFLRGKFMSWGSCNKQFTRISLRYPT